MTFFGHQSARAHGRMWFSGHCWDMWPQRVQQSESKHCMFPQVDLRKSKLLWLEAEKLKATARRSAEIVDKNAEDHDSRAKEAARQKGPHR